MEKISTLQIPPEVSRITKTLKDAGFEAYIVGGCVRDLLIGKKPKDWDITTNATPEKIVSLFPKTFYENEYGTVGVVNEEVKLADNSFTDETLHIVEVTPYRLEAGYSDRRRPDAVSWSNHLEDDLKRRDFTINAMAILVGENGKADNLIDIYQGQEDIQRKIIRTVGNPIERFSEDALRIIRAVRLSSELDFAISEETTKAIEETAHLLSHIAKERIRDEFIRILQSSEPMKGLILSQKLGILPYIAPELLDSIGVEQNQAHAFHVWEHLLRSLQHSADKKWPLEIRLAALFHDISKPETRRWSEEKKEWTFYGHEVVGARVTRKILENLRFPKKTIEKVSKMVRWHMFFSDTEQISLSAVRRMIRNVGQENIWDLMNVRICDRIGTGRPKESPYRLRKYQSMIEEALRDPISVGLLKIDGTGIMKATESKPGPKIGFVLHALLEEVLDDPKRNTPEHLENRARELIKLPIEDLKKLGEEGKEKRDELEEKEIKKLRKKHHVE